MIFKFTLTLTALNLVGFDVRAGQSGSRISRSTGSESPIPQSKVCSQEALEAKIDIVVKAAEEDPCLNYPNSSNNSINNSMDYSRGNSMDTRRASPRRPASRLTSGISTSSLSDNAVNANNACANAGAIFLELPYSYRSPCPTAKGAKCVMKKGSYGCYFTVTSKTLGVTTTQTVKFSECAQFVTVYKAKQRLAGPAPPTNRRGRLQLLLIPTRR